MPRNSSVEAPGRPTLVKQDRWYHNLPLRRAGETLNFQPSTGLLPQPQRPTLVVTAHYKCSTCEPGNFAKWPRGSGRSPHHPYRENNRTRWNCPEAIHHHCFRQRGNSTSLEQLDISERDQRASRQNNEVAFIHRRGHVQLGSRTPICALMPSSNTWRSVTAPLSIFAAEVAIS